MDNEEGFEERKYQLEMKKLRQARADTWTRFVGTVLVAGAITGAIQWYGIREENATRERTEKAQQGQMLIQLANAREAAFTDLRAQMFQALLQNYFKQASRRERIAILELIGLNFRDAVQIKPMFELLDTELYEADVSTQEETTALRKVLRKSAQSIIKDQLDQMTVGEWGKPACFPLLSVKLAEDPTSSEIAIRTNTKHGLFLSGDKAEGGDKFKVTYFDMPMVDYTLARGNARQPWKYSIVLREVSPDKAMAKVAVAVLPESSFSMNDRYAFDSYLSTWLKPTAREPR